MERNVTVTIHGFNADEVRDEMAKLLGVYDHSRSPSTATPEPPETARPVEQQPQPEPSAPVEQPAEQSDNDEGPKKVRGKNAEKVKAELLQQVADGVGVDNDKFAKLPKNHQQEVEEAIKQRYSPAEQPKPDPVAAAGQSEPAANDSADETAQAAEQAEAETTAGEQVPDVSEAREALKSVMAAKGQEACGKILASFNARKVSEVPEDQRAAFIQACEEAQG
jgi:hypothetical protein